MRHGLRAGHGLHGLAGDLAEIFAGDDGLALVVRGDVLGDAHHEPAHDEREVLLRAGAADLLLNVREGHDLQRHAAGIGRELFSQREDLLLGELRRVREGEKVHRDEAHAALCDHVRGHGAVNAAGQQRHGRAVAADGHAARRLDGLRVDIRRLLAHLEAHGQLRIVHVDDRIGKRLGELAANVLRQLNARHGKALVRALGLHLEAVRRRHRVVQVCLGKGRDGVLVLLAGGRARDRRDAEHLAHGVIRRVEVGRVVSGLDVQRRLQIRHAEVADGFEPALDVRDQPLFKIVLVEALEEDLSGLAEQQILHKSFVPFLSGYHRQRSMSVMNTPTDHAPSHTSSRHTSTPRISPMSEQT